MAIVTLHSRPVRIGKKWVWRLTRTGVPGVDGPKGTTVDITTRPGAVKAFKDLILDAYSHGHTVHATSVDQTENGFSAVYEQGKPMVEKAIGPGDILGPRCSTLPRPKEASGRRREVVRHGREKPASSPKASPKKPARKPRKPAKVATPKAKTPKAKTPSPKKRKPPAGGAARLAEFNAKVAAYKAANPGVSHREAQQAVKAGASVSPKRRPATSKTARAATPKTRAKTPAKAKTPRPPTPKPKTPKPRTPEARTVAKPRTPPRPATPKTRVKTPAKPASPPRSPVRSPVRAESDAEKEARLSAAMDAALGNLFGSG